MKYEEPYEYALRLAKKEISVADHLTYVTYISVKTPKFLVSIAGHIITSAKLALQSLLEYELNYKRIEPYVASLASQIDLFEEQVYERYDFSIEHLNLLRRLRKFSDSSKKAVISFPRDEKYYFGSPTMSTESIGIDDIKKYLRFTKSFIESVSKIISKK